MKKANHLKRWDAKLKSLRLLKENDKIVSCQKRSCLFAMRRTGFFIDDTIKIRRKSVGLTLIEMVIAIGILALVLPTILMAFLNARILNETNRNRTTAMSHAQYVMEEIKATSFSSIANNINNGNWDLNTSDITALGLSALTNELIDTQVNGTGELDVSVNVTWQERAGRNHSIGLETIFVNI